MKISLKTLLSLFFLISPAFAADSSDPSGGHEMKRIAYSSKLGVEVFAETTNGKWCANAVSLKVFAHDETAFDEALLTKLTEKVGRVLESECPEVVMAVLDGYNDNTLVYQGGASRAENWKPEKGVLKRQIRMLQAAAAKTNESARWVPPAGKQKLMAHIDKNSALEHRIYSKDKKCSIYYTTDLPEKTVSQWSIVVGDNSCSENLIYGKANVTLFNEKGKYAGNADGYFIEGRFTGNRNLNMVLLNRYGYNRNLQNLSYLIETDPELKIHYIGFLSSRRNPKTGRYSVWAGCSPFTIAAVTDNEELFLESGVTGNIVKTAQSFADIFCPGTKKMKFFATKVPQGIAGMDQPEAGELSEDPNLIYSAVMQRGKDHKWKAVSDTAQNLARLREMKRREEETREHQLMMADYNELTRSDYLGRLAYMHGVERIDNPLSMLVASKIVKNALPVNSLVRISSLGKESAWADWPVPIKLTETAGLLNRTGWHIVSGNLAVLPDAQKKAADLSDAHFAGTLELSAATACEEEGCREISDVAALVRRRHDKPSWTPYHAPFRMEGR